jgi:hypothetical protein
MEAACSSETSVDLQRTARRYVPEDGTLHRHRCENLKSYMILSSEFFSEIFYLFIFVVDESVRNLSYRFNLGIFLIFFFICIVGGGIKVHSTLRPLSGLLCQPRVIMIMEKSVE